MSALILRIFLLPAVIFVVSAVGIIGALVANSNYDGLFNLMAACPVGYAFYFYFKHKYIKPKHVKPK